MSTKFCMPWMSCHGLGLNFNHLDRVQKSYSLRSEQFYDRLQFSRLVCRRSDDFDDSDFGDPSYIYATRFCRLPGAQDVLALANEDGKVIIQNTALSGNKSILTYFEAHNNAIFDVAWVPGSRTQVVTVSGDQSSKLWDFSQVSTAAEVEEVRVFRGYCRSVKCVEFAPDDPNLFATGSRENAIFLWDIRSPSDSKPVNAIRNAHLVQSLSAMLPRPSKRRRESISSVSATSLPSSSVTAIQFQDSNTLISSSDCDGIIKVWDLRKSYDRYNSQPMAKYQFNYPGKSALKGYSSLAINASKTQLFASCKDHSIYKFDIAGYSAKPTATYTGFENNSKYFCRISLSHDERYLVSGSSDNFARVWNVGPYGPSEPIARLEGHEAEVTCVEWCSNDFRLVTCGDDMKHRTWRLAIDKTDIDANDISGEAKMNTDVAYVDVPNYIPSTSVAMSNSATITPSSSLSAVKRKIFCNENDRNIENQLSSIRISSRLPGLNSPTPGTSCQFPCSPSKMLISPSKRPFGSPRKIILSPRKLAIFNSPTSRLPNLVLDELASPGSTTKSAEKKRQRLDWLTSLSRQKKQQVTSDPGSGSKKVPEAAKSSPRTVRAKRKL